MDRQGSPVAVLDDAGSLVAINTYDESGQPGANNYGRISYTGAPYIPEADLLHLRARDYSYRLGRFLQTDPVGYKDGLNWYAYVHDDPLNRSDPSGLQTVMGPVYDGLDRATAGCSGDTRCGLKTWNRTQQGVAENVAISAAADGLGALALRGLSIAAKALGIGEKAAEGAEAQSALLQRYLTGSGGRWGGAWTRALNDRLATDLESQGYTVTGGAGRASEEWIAGPGGGTKGGTFVDITATNGQSIVRIQTIGTKADGITPTLGESAAAARIRSQFPNDSLTLIPKK